MTLLSRCRRHWRWFTRATCKWRNHWETLRIIIWIDTHSRYHVPRGNEKTRTTGPLNAERLAATRSDSQRLVWRTYPQPTRSVHHDFFTERCNYSLWCATAIVTAIVQRSNNSKWGSVQSLATVIMAVAAQSLATIYLVGDCFEAADVCQILKMLNLAPISCWMA